MLRPGRQKFFREFDLLSWEQASRLAEKLGITLPQRRPWSLAELYHFSTLPENQLGAARPRPIGFGQ